MSVRQFAIAVGLVVVAPLHLSAQQSPPRDALATLGGTISQDSTRAAIGDAELVLTPVGHGDGARQLRTTWRGEFLFTALRPGAYQIAIRHLGFRTLTDTLTLGAGSQVVRAWSMAVVPYELAPVQVKADEVKYISPRLRGFEERKKNNAGGYFVDEAVFRKSDLNNVADLLASRISGAYEVIHGSHIHFASHAGEGSTMRALPGADLLFKPIPHACWVTLYVDGIRVYYAGSGQDAPDFSGMPISEYAAAEFYPHGPSTPQEFSAMNQFDCGTLLLWTRER